VWKPIQPGSAERARGAALALNQAGPGSMMAYNPPGRRARHISEAAAAGSG